MKRAEWAKGFWCKAAAYVLAVALMPLICVCVASLIFAYENHWWAGAADIYESDPVRDAVYEQMASAQEYYEHFGAEIVKESWFVDPHRTNLRFAIYDGDGTQLFDNLSTDGTALNISIPLDAAAGVHMEGGVAAELKAQDGIYWAVWLMNWMLLVFHSAAPALAVSVGALLFLVVFLARAAGRRPGTEEAVAGWQEQIPLDLYLAVVGAGLVFSVLLLDEWDYLFMQDLLPFLLLCLALTFLASALLLGTWMTVCTRLKLGKWWRNTVVFWLLSLGWRVLRWCGRTLCSIVRSLPLVWKTGLALAGICLYDLICIGFRRDTDVLIFLWLMGKAVLIPAVLYASLQLKKLQAGGAALAAGNLNAKVDTRRMAWDFKRHAENLNDISQGMQLAVEQQLKSERLKTELITNVSHDIKTPLTSIINYVGLLRRDPGGEQAGEYLQVLDRQSQRLKKLTEDLVEVSKASTGNIAVSASRRSVNELLMQSLGEYGERLEKAGLETVLTLPEKEAFVWADGTLVWRVLDNVFSNACKYALPGTRFYVDASEQEARVKFIFKNISRERLNVSAEELMERFVRGDTSRSSEGSGLGLNIAKSLTELQGGSFQIFVDGDLFRVDITLPVSR